MAGGSGPPRAIVVRRCTPKKPKSATYRQPSGKSQSANGPRLSLRRPCSSPGPCSSPRSTSKPHEQLDGRWTRSCTAPTAPPHLGQFAGHRDAGTVFQHHRAELLEQCDLHRLDLHLLATQPLYHPAQQGGSLLAVPSPHPVTPPAH